MIGGGDRSECVCVVCVVCVVCADLFVSFFPFLFPLPLSLLPLPLPLSLLPQQLRFLANSPRFNPSKKFKTCGLHS